MRIDQYGNVILDEDMNSDAPPPSRFTPPPRKKKRWGWLVFVAILVVILLNNQSFFEFLSSSNQQIAEVYEEPSWHIDWLANNKSETDSTNTSSYLYENEKFYFHFSLEGGPAGEFIVPQYTISRNGTQVSSGSFSSSWGRGSILWVSYTPSSSGTYSLRLWYYDEYGNTVQLGTTSVTITARSSQNTKKPTTSKSWPVGERCKINSSSGNARSGPGTEYSIVEVVKKGQTYEIIECKLGSTGKDWYKIKVSGQYCWVSSGIVELNGNTEGTRNRIPLD